MKQGDFVTRISYRHDVVFKIEYIDQHEILLRGVEFRLLADAPSADLVKAEERLTQNLERLSYNEKSMRLLEETRMKQIDENLREISDKMEGADSYFEVPGKVLHLDGDEAYLHKSLDLYKQLKVPAVGHFMKESEMSDALVKLLPKVRPDIIVITGHDGMLKERKDDKGLSGYKNSANFVKAIQAARHFERNRDGLTIIAGACQSHFEALLRAGANFASSPGRILIHALDPVHIATKVSYTSIKDTINMVDVISHTVSGIKGMGGIESRGSYRIGLPNFSTE